MEGWDDGSTALVACVDAAAAALLQVGDGGACVWYPGRRGAPNPNPNPDLGGGGGAPPLSAHLCTRHRPTEPSETARLSVCGVEPSATGRVSGLAVSRAFGDLSIKQQPHGAYLTVEPEVRPLDEHEHLCDGAVLVLACDGVWDYLSIDEAADVLCRAHDAQSSVCAAEVALRDAAAALADAALESGSSDNVSVLLVQLPDWKG